MPFFVVFGTLWVNLRDVRYVWVVPEEDPEKATFRVSVQWAEKEETVYDVPAADVEKARRLLENLIGS